MPVRVSRRGLVVPPRLRVPAALWGLFAIETAIVALWPRFFVDTMVDDLIGWLRASLEPQLPALRGAAGVVARLGAREVLVPVLLGAAGWLGWRRRSVVPPALLAGSYLLVASVTGLVKAGLARPQPLPLADVPGRAFPSGHAAQAVVVFGALALLAATGRSQERRRAMVVAAALVVGSVSAALLWRQAHWLTDMVGGVTLGLACLATVDAALTAAVSRRDGRRTPVASRE
jgi:membrane-associated phospholipid phosphatase